MKFEFKSRFNASVIIHTQEIPDNTEPKLQCRVALELAVKARANLARAYLAGAYLAGANLADANLARANLARANLAGANLARAYLAGAYLADAYLADAYLADTNLADANLARAYLAGAYLPDAKLAGANLADANLAGANLAGANLAGANLAQFKQDFIAEILKLPNELEALRLAIVEGRIDGSTYSGECACLAGTLAKSFYKSETGLPDGHQYQGEAIKVNGFSFTASIKTPREQWFLQINKGDVPEKNSAAKIALEWLDEAIAMRDHIRKST